MKGPHVAREQDFGINGQVRGFLLYITIVTVALIASAANRLHEFLQRKGTEEVGYESARPYETKDTV